MIDSERIVARFRQARLEPGQGMENGTLRISRLMGSLHLLDLTNAGKRGKTVERVVLEPNNMTQAESQLFLGRMVVFPEHYESLRQAMGGVKDYLVDFPDDLKISTSQVRAVDVIPAGFRPIRIDTPDISVRVDHSDFTVTNKRDVNETSCMPAAKAGIKEVPVFYRWVQDNESEVRRMTYSDMLGKLKELGVTYRTYCALD